MGEKWQPRWHGLILIIAHRGHATFTEYTADIMHVSLCKYVTQKQISQLCYGLTQLSSTQCPSQSLILTFLSDSDAAGVQNDINTALNAWKTNMQV